jgi:hypothetical protein
MEGESGHYPWRLIVICSATHIHLCSDREKRVFPLAAVNWLCYSSPPSKKLQRINKLRRDVRGLFEETGQKKKLTNSAKRFILFLLRG